MGVSDKWGEEMRIGDEVYVHGYVDEIRYDDTKRVSTVIIRNDGGYFGTVPSEIDNAPTIDAVSVVRCKECVRRKNNGFCLEHNRYEKNDNGYCSYGEREGK